MATTVKAEAAHRDQYVHDAWAALIQEALEPVLVISLVTYWIWQVWLSASVSPARVSQAVTITLYMACLFTLCWHTLKRRPHASAAIWIGGLYLGALIGALLYRSSWPYLVMPLTNLVCSLLLGRTMGAGGARHRPGHGRARTIRGTQLAQPAGLLGQRVRFPARHPAYQVLLGRQGSTTRQLHPVGSQRPLISAVLHARSLRTEQCVMPFVKALALASSCRDGQDAR